MKLRAPRPGFAVEQCWMGPDSGRVRAPIPRESVASDGSRVVFLRAPGANTYYEFNLAPSSQWAAYAFAAYRERAPDPDTPAPFIDAEGGRTRFELRAALDVAHLGLPADGPWRAGLSAVLEADDGTRAFWALAHPPGQPDFHHADAFALSLPPPQA